MDLDKLAEAAKDYRYLLDRGYPRKPSLDLVVSRYVLNHSDRMALYRCVHTSKEARSVRSKLCIACTRIVLDLFNNLITILAIIKSEPIYLCDDCLVRDVRGSKIRRGDEPFIDYAVKLLVQGILLAKPVRVEIVCDKNVSFSLRYARLVEEALCREKVVASIHLASKADVTTIDLCRALDACAASTDFVVCSNVPRIYPLTTIVLLLLRKAPLFDFATLFETPCKDLEYVQHGIYAKHERDD